MVVVRRELYKMLRITASLTYPYFVPLASIPVILTRPNLTASIPATKPELDILISAPAARVL